MSQRIYEPVIGLEIHTELLTTTKMFCRCPIVDVTMAAPNSSICTVCTGQPGALPVINKRAIEYAHHGRLGLKLRNPKDQHFCPQKLFFIPICPKAIKLANTNIH